MPFIFPNPDFGGGGGGGSLSPIQFAQEPVTVYIRGMIGNGGSIGGYGGLANTQNSFTTFDVLGQNPAQPASINFYERIANFQFSQNIWGATLGTNGLPIIIARPAAFSVVYRANVPTAGVTWLAGFSNGGVPIASPVETQQSNFIGFMVNPDPQLTIQRLIRVAGVSAIADTGIPKPTATEILRFLVALSPSSNEMLFSIDRMNPDFSYSNIYSTAAPLLSAGNVAYGTCIGGPAAAGSFKTVYSIQTAFALGC